MHCKMVNRKTWQRTKVKNNRSSDFVAKSRTKNCTKNTKWEKIPSDNRHYKYKSEPIIWRPSSHSFCLKLPSDNQSAILFFVSVLLYFSIENFTLIYISLLFLVLRFNIFAYIMKIYSFKMSILKSHDKFLHSHPGLLRLPWRFHRCFFFPRFPRISVPFSNFQTMNVNLDWIICDVLIPIFVRNFQFFFFLSFLFAQGILAREIGEESEPYTWRAFVKWCRNAGLLVKIEKRLRATRNSKFWRAIILKGLGRLKK